MYVKVKNIQIHKTRIHLCRNSRSVYVNILSIAVGNVRIEAVHGFKAPLSVGIADPDFDIGSFQIVAHKPCVSI